MMSLSHGFELGRKQGFRQITTAKVENAQHDNLRLMTPVVFDKSDGRVAKEPPARREEALEHANKQLQIENEKLKSKLARLQALVGELTDNTAPATSSSSRAVE